MGGYGSGRRWHYGAKDTTSDYRSLDIRRWKRDGLLTPGQSFGWQWSRHDEVLASIRVRIEERRLFLIYRHSNRGEDKWQAENYPVCLDWTECHLGGQRPWFICPANNCGRRVAILYSGSIFACRHCYQLAYESQREAPHDRACRRADRIREKLDWPGGILEGSGWGKPKGMHKQTFERLIAQHDAFVRISISGMAKHLNLMDYPIEDLI